MKEQPVADGTDGAAHADNEIHDLNALLDRLAEACAAPEITLGRLLEQVGSRSFGTVLLVPAIIVLSPLSGIPGLPSVMAVFVVVLAGQMLEGRDHLVAAVVAAALGTP